MIALWTGCARFLIPIDEDVCVVEEQPKPAAPRRALPAPWMLITEQPGEMVAHRTAPQLSGHVDHSPATLSLRAVENHGMMVPGP
jgi:hypothetical protein